MELYVGLGRATKSGIGFFMDLHLCRLKEWVDVVSAVLKREAEAVKS